MQSSQQAESETMTLLLALKWKHREDDFSSRSLIKQSWTETWHSSSEILYGKYFIILTRYWWQANLPTRCVDRGRCIYVFHWPPSPRPASLPLPGPSFPLPGLRRSLPRPASPLPVPSLPLPVPSVPMPVLSLHLPGCVAPSPRLRRSLSPACRLLSPACVAHSPRPAGPSHRPAPFRSSAQYQVHPPPLARR